MYIQWLATDHPQNVHVMFKRSRWCMLNNVLYMCWCVLYQGRIQNFLRGGERGGALIIMVWAWLQNIACTLQEKYGYPKLSGLEKLGINSQKLP